MKLKMLITCAILAGAVAVYAGTRPPYAEAQSRRTLTMEVDSVVDDSSFVYDTTGIIINLHGFTTLDYQIVIQPDTTAGVLLPGIGNKDSTRLFVQVSHGFEIAPAGGATGPPQIMGKHWHTIDSIIANDIGGDTLEHHWFGDDGDSLSLGDVRIVTYLADTTSDTTATQPYYLFYWFMAVQ